MELTIARQDLARVLGLTQGIAGRRTTMPILGAVRIQAEGEGVTVAATDLDLTIRLEAPARVQQPGSAVLSARRLFDIARALPDGDVVLRTKPNHWAEIESGTDQFRLVGFKPEDFPELPSLSGIAMVALDDGSLLSMIDKTLFAVSTDETRYNLTGVYFEPRNAGSLRMVATDGHRLCLIDQPVDQKVALDRGVILPRKGLVELKRMLAEEGASGCSIGFSGTSAVFQRPGVSLFMRLVEGEFPDYEQVIPRESDKALTLSREMFLSKLQRVSLMADDKANMVRLDLGTNMLRISSEDPDSGNAKVEIPLEYVGPELRIGFNARYLKDILSAVDSEEVSFGLSDDLSPGVIRPRDDSHYTAVVMPMRVMG